MSYGRGPPEIHGMVSLKVDNLTYRTTPEDLRHQFQKFGEVGDVYIPRDRFTRESRGFAFVRYYERRDAEDALAEMDGFVLDGREVRCQMARYGRPSEPSHHRRGPPRRSSYGGGGRRNRSRSRSYSRSPRRDRDSRRHRRSRSRSNSRSRSPSGSRSRSRGKNQASRSRSRSPDQNGGDTSD